MENQSAQTPTMEDLSSPILPIGWDSETDIFSDDFMNSDLPQADGSAEAEESDSADTENGSEETEEVVLTTDENEEESDESEEEANDQPTTQEEGTQPKTISFKATINHKEQDVELDESEWPEVYQKYVAFNKVRGKLDKMTPTYEKSEMVKELLGYTSIDEMLDAAEQAYVDSEVEKLVNDNVSETLAKDYVARKVKEIKEGVRKSSKAAPQDTENKEAEATTDSSTVANGRDFAPEVAQLLKVRPDLKGKTVPQEVIKQAVDDDVPLAVAYLNYESKLNKADTQKLRKENKTIKQNAEAAKRAPVKSVTESGPTNATADDPFLTGFNKAFK